MPKVKNEVLEPETYTKILLDGIINVKKHNIALVKQLDNLKIEQS